MASAVSEILFAKMRYHFIKDLACEFGIFFQQLLDQPSRCRMPVRPILVSVERGDRALPVRLLC